MDKQNTKTSGKQESFIVTLFNLQYSYCYCYNIYCWRGDITRSYHKYYYLRLNKIYFMMLSNLYTLLFIYTALNTTKNIILEAFFTIRKYLQQHCLNGKHPQSVSVTLVCGQQLEFLYFIMCYFIMGQFTPKSSYAFIRPYAENKSNYFEESSQ